ncbi:glycosyltransferase [Anaerobaca lacustris]|uniref:Glycosyltransferase n=1 Tax=Anaerobaca lacustris TaxID=3044600 RepID=A0AAW6TXE1_9BACT|nr:glycosyltransferase [Sedimentisphaerales bacterium M17dextr]
MTTQTGANAYQRGLELADAGKYEAALGCIQEHLRRTPLDAQALNDAGAILHCLRRSDEAIGHLVKAHALQADSGEIVWNLVEAYLAAGMAAEAASLIETMERMKILSIEVLNRIATMLLDQDRKGLAVEVLLHSRRLWPEQEVLNPILEVIRNKRPKIALFRVGDSLDGALAEAWAFLQERFQTEFCTDQGPDELTRLMQWCDIAWFDGGGSIAVEASQRPRSGKTIVSLRRSDVRDDWVRLVRWEHVDILVLIGSPAVEEALLKWIPDIRNRTRVVVVPNGINVERFAFQPRARGKNLACIGRLSMEANPAFLLQCMQKLRYLDAGYRLFFSGDFESPMLEQYTRHMVQTLGLTDAVSFEPYPSDLNAWLGDKHFIVSCSIGEGQIESLLTGMACGLKPIAHNFAGAERLFPSTYLFNIAEEFCECALGREYDPAAYRRFVEERYPIHEQLRQIGGILNQLEAEIDAQCPVAGSDRSAVGIAGIPAPQGNRLRAGGPVNAAGL